MDNIKYGIVVCEKCFQIPEITMINQTKVQIKCTNTTCKDIQIKDFSYFEKYLKNIERESWTEMPKCTFNKEHESKSFIYCFQCGTYICDECINIHNKMPLRGIKHIFIKQKINSKYYCDKKGHKENILKFYCTLCKDYFCSSCKCNHEKSHIFDFENIENEKMIQIIIDKINKSQKIIKDEEKKLNKFLEEIDNKIKAIKNIFKIYKERNQKIISFYNLLINNYEYFNNIRSYNIYNNIINNDNFDLSTSDNFIKEKDKEVNECFSSIYNKLYSFYINKLHIRTKEYTNHYITQKFCKKLKVKKITIVNNKLICFIFDNENNLYFLNKDDINYYQKRKLNCKYIKDIYPLNSKELIIMDENNTLQIYNIEGNKSINITTKYKDNNFDFIIPNLINKNNFFMVSNSKDIFYIYYYVNNKKIFLLYKENKNYNNNCLFDEINKIIKDSKINLEDEKQLKKFFSCSENITIEELIKLDKDLLEKSDNLLENLYKNIKNKFNENDNNKYVINSNYIYHIIKDKLEKKNNITLTNEENININYISRLNDIYNNIRKKYLWCIVLNTKINNIYNFNNQYLIFMGENYLFIKYSIKDKEFIPLIRTNYIFNTVNNFNHFEIKHISQNYIILNNMEEKTISFIDTSNFCVLNKKFNYYSNIVANDISLLFDNIKDNEVQFSLLNLSDLSNNNNLNEFFNIKIYNYFPKIIFNYNFEIFIYLYDNNQLCITDYIPNEDKSNTNEIKTTDLSIKKNDLIIPKIDNCSEVYSQNYDASKLFSNDVLFSNDFYGHYYCSKNNMKQYIVFDCGNEYFFNSFQIIYLSRKNNCKPKHFIVSILDKYKNVVNIFKFENKNINIESEEYNLKNKGRYIRFDLLDNYGGNYFIIKNLKFYANPIDSVEFYPLV